MTETSHFVCLHDKQMIERFLRKNLHLNIYSIGDLDDFFWPYTIWYGAPSHECIEAIVLVYFGLSLPTVLAFSDQTGEMTDLLSSIRHLLPSRFYAHLSLGLETVLLKTHDLVGHGEHYKMALLDKMRVPGLDTSEVERLKVNDLNDIQKLYNGSYPDNWFDPRMLETGQYFGIREDGRLICVAGVHVYSPFYRVAALGNITTLPTQRNRGYGARVTAKLCQSLLNERMDIGLNVKTDNTAALSCYHKIGFDIIARYNEFMVNLKR